MEVGEVTVVVEEEVLGVGNRLDPYPWETGGEERGYRMHLPEETEIGEEGEAGGSVLGSAL